MRVGGGGGKFIVGAEGAGESLAHVSGSEGGWEGEVGGKDEGGVGGVRVGEGGGRWDEHRIG